MRDYWSFPAVLRSFKATGYGKYRRIEGLEYRVRGGDYVLVDPPKRPFLIPAEANRDRIRSLSFLEGTIGSEVPVKRAGWVWGVDDLVGFKPNKKTRYALRLAERDGAELVKPSEGELRLLFEEWVDWMGERKPSTMLVKGHYLEMIVDKGFSFLACKVGDELVGASGVTWCGRDGAVCFTKHRPGLWWLSRYLWWHSLQTLFRRGVVTVNCGDTADTLKKELGFTRSPQFKVDFSKLEQAQCTTTTGT